MESLAIHHIQPFMFHDTAFKAVKGTFAAFVIESSPHGVVAYEVGIYEEDGEPAKAENRMYMELLDLEELKTYPRVLGSGGFHVLAAFRAISGIEGAHIPHTDIVESFKAAASVILSINDTVDMHRFKLPKKAVRK